MRESERGREGQCVWKMECVWGRERRSELYFSEMNFWFTISRLSCPCFLPFSRLTLFQIWNFFSFFIFFQNFRISQNWQILSLLCKRSVNHKNIIFATYLDYSFAEIRSRYFVMEKSSSFFFCSIYGNRANVTRGNYTFGLKSLNLNYAPLFSSTVF